MAYVTADIGSISSGTMRTEDLLETYADELEYLMKREDKRVKNDNQQAALTGNVLAEVNGRHVEYAKLITEARDIDPDSDEASELVDELADALQEYAPAYCYFGAHEGDGADYGFWPSWEEIDELPTVEDSDEAKALGEDCKSVNDHGNVTVYGGDGSVIWDCV